MKSIFIIALIFAVAFSHTLKLETQLLKDLWEQWKLSNNKVYTMAEEDAKFSTFADNYLQILEFNALNSEVTLGLNAFADLSLGEFESQYLGLKSQNKQDAHADYHVFDTNSLPESVDWRKKGAVNDVKNQGKCGSCWTFSAVAALEGLRFIDTGKLESFSEQNLVSCAHGKYNESQGCAGGLMTDAFDYVAENGIQYEADYPYTATNGTCTAVKSKAVMINVAYKNVTANSVEQLKAAIAQQPVSVAVQAGGLPWQFYRAGVLRWLCGDALNHGITAVGYGKEKGSEAFIVRNSWGPTWGDKGYVHISTAENPNHKHGVCGILMDSSFPISK